ncbi:hypothetical protein ARMSODRAFT_977957 [Armillaria solidipes]|uniref:Uncharacterized protein n=1 Tax=Armillaria solidipes TaxID=1076256 RepID=A0A2H3BPU4_9AGAR|nr:hypothetical protein ARMSODRAFT_977957 [Armillaria solidipes]
MFLETQPKFQLLLAYPAYPAAEAVPEISAPSKRARFEAWGNEEWTLGIFRSEAVGFVRPCLLVVKNFPKANIGLQAWNWSRYRRSMNLFITRIGTKKVPAGDTCRFWRTGAITGCVFGGPGCWEGRVRKQQSFTLVMEENETEKSRRLGERSLMAVAQGNSQEWRRPDGKEGDDDAVFELLHHQVAL